jgi:hypothetical protein
MVYDAVGHVAPETIVAIAVKLVTGTRRKPQSEEKETDAREKCANSGDGHRRRAPFPVAAAKNAATTFGKSTNHPLLSPLK